MSDERMAIDTGAASGVGRAVAARFARDGCQVLLADHLFADGVSVEAVVSLAGILESCAARGHADGRIRRDHIRRTYTASY